MKDLSTVVCAVRKTARLSLGGRSVVGRNAVRCAAIIGLLATCMGLTQVGTCVPGGQTGCATNAECNDNNACTTDTCNTDGTCSNVADCDATHCVNNACVECLGNGECDDNSACTTDTCGTDGTCAYETLCDTDHCVNDACVECVGDSECGDGDDCTTDACTDNACTNTPIEGCTQRSLAVFTDPDTGFSTSDVRDVNEEIINFDTNAKSIIYVATGVEYQPGSWDVNGNFLDAGQAFEVRFGTVAGEHHAYFTETGSTYICDFQVSQSVFQILPTTTSVPQN